MDTPVEVQARRGERQVAIQWASGHASQYLADYLRGYCPCAICQGHGPEEKVFHPPAQPISVESVKPVGAYALQFVWSDQHSTGLYTYEYLRSLCPCCRQA
jgi:DUF971 family protein